MTTIFLYFEFIFGLWVFWLHGLLFVYIQFFSSFVIFSNFYELLIRLDGRNWKNKNYYQNLIFLNKYKNQPKSEIFLALLQKFEIRSQISHLDDGNFWGFRIHRECLPRQFHIYYISNFLTISVNFQWI